MFERQVSFQEKHILLSEQQGNPDGVRFQILRHLQSYSMILLFASPVLLLKNFSKPVEHNVDQLVKRTTFTFQSA